MGKYPKIQKKVEAEAPAQINVYSDGAVKNDTNQDIALGGYGIWWPGLKMNEKEYVEGMARIKDLVVTEEWQGGMAMWGPLKGIWHSSTRAELAGLVIAAFTVNLAGALRAKILVSQTMCAQLHALQESTAQVPPCLQGGLPTRRSEQLRCHAQQGEKPCTRH